MFAGPANAINALFPETRWVISTASPTAYIFSSDVSIVSSTAIEPFVLNANPDFSAKALSGTTPTDTITISVLTSGIFSPEITSFSPSETSFTLALNKSLIPCDLSFEWTNDAISESNILRS